MLVPYAGNVFHDETEERYAVSGFRRFVGQWYQAIECSWW
jgi:hypothetical protein